MKRLRPRGHAFKTEPARTTRVLVSTESLVMGEKYPWRRPFLGWGLFFLMTILAEPFGYAGNFTVRYVEGESSVLPAGQTEWQKLHKGRVIQLGDRVVCSEGGMLQIESAQGVLELADSTDLLIRSLASAQTDGSATLELSSGQVKGDWSGSFGNALTVQVPGGVFQIENGFFSLCIYSLLGRPYTRVDLFRGEGFLQETSESILLTLSAGQHMTTGLQFSEGPRTSAAIPGFDVFEIDFAGSESSAVELSDKNAGAFLGAAQP